jgi:hypothetical protein
MPHGVLPLSNLAGRLPLLWLSRVPGRIWAG